MNWGMRHIQGDAKDACMSRKWDLIIVHPPCTRLCDSGQRWLYWGDAEYQAKKRKEQIEAVMFFMWFANFAEITGTQMAIENPVGIMSSLYRKPDFSYNPYDFEGETESKKTCIWSFNGLPDLKPTQNLPKEQRTKGIWRGHFEINGERKKLAWNDPMCAKMRSVTPAGVAKAMAEQWGGVIYNSRQTMSEMIQTGGFEGGDE